jgi:CubicO group peptidase (beta-lactamase class C family)
MLALLLLPLAVAVADTTPKFLAPQTIPELEARIRKVLDSTKTPGVGLAIVRHDSIIYTGGIGKARVSPALPANAATLFRIGSTSKQFVALTAMALVHEGKLSLDDKLSDRLPGFYFRNQWESTDPVRIIHLLEHTAGFDDNSLKAYASSDPKPLTLAEALPIDSLSRTSRWRPGTRFSYCNTGPGIVARIIETIEGKPFEQVVQERWFTPIGMRTATYLFPDSTKTERATLYRDDGTTPVPYWHVWARPAGSINASANDMAAYLRFVLGRGTVNGSALLPASDFATLEHAQSWIGTRAGLSIGYGKHLYQTTDSTGYIWTGHNGGVEGGLSDLSYIPELGIGYSTLINSGSGTAQSEIEKLVRAYLTRTLIPPAPPPPGGAVPAGVRTRYAGWYREVNPRMQHLYMLTYLSSLQRVSFIDSAAVISPLLSSSSRTLIAVDSLRFREKGEGTATHAFVPAAMNDGVDGLHTARFGESFNRVSTAVALTQIVLAVLWALTFVLSLVAMVFGALRWLVRRLRKRATPVRPPSATLWRWVALTAAVLAANLQILAVAANSLRAIGSRSPLSVSAWLLGLLFAAIALLGLILAVRRRTASTRWERTSLLTARTAAVMQAVAAGYLIAFGFIGWKTWV